MFFPQLNQNQSFWKFIPYLVCIVFIIVRYISFPPQMLNWDTFGYYLYLPSKFIYNDIFLQQKVWLDELILQYEPTSTLYQAIKTENGNWVFKYTMGLAILYTPFFFIAHVIAQPLGYAADGLSAPYQVSITIGGLIYLMIGLFVLLKILRHFFDLKLSMIVFLIIIFGTNYFQLMLFDGTLLSHNFLFTFYALLIFYTIKWHQNPNKKSAIAIGALIGFMTLIRPSEAVSVLIPIFWPGNGSYFKTKIQLFKDNFPHIILVGIFAFLMLLPQLIYWKLATGSFLFFSYTNPGEGLDLLSPHTYNFLFSYRKGWLLYTPIVLVSFAGIFILIKNRNPLFIVLSIFVVFSVYIISSWTNWWYAGASFSSRAIVPIYTLLAIPLGFFIQEMTKWRVVFRYFSVAIIVGLLTLNLFQTWQFQNRIISRERMTKAYYWAIFGKTEVDKNAEKLLSVERSFEEFEILKNEENYTSKMLYENNFDDIKNDSISADAGFFTMNEANQFSPGIDFTFKELTQKDHAWFRISTSIFIPDSLTDWPILVATFHHKNQAYKYVTKQLDKSQVHTNDFNEISLDYLTPEVRNEADNLKVYLWYSGKNSIKVDYLKIKIFEPKN